MSETYRIKPFQWSGNSVVRANGVYEIQQSGERYAWYLNLRDGIHDGRGKYVGTEGEAKQGAEDHYRHMLSFDLEPS